MNNGWIKLHRRMLDNPIVSKPNYHHLWITLLLMANHKENKIMWNGEFILIKEGQILTGRNELAKQSHLPPSTIERILKYLENGHQIEQQKTTKYRVITILNWSEYQKADSKVDIKRTSNGHQTDTNNNVKECKRMKKKRTVEPSSTEFSFNNKLDLLLKDTDKRMPIIGNYWLYRKILFDNHDQYQAGLKRELRPAKSLIGYDIKRIKDVMFWLNGQEWIDWTLETVHKYIDKDLNKLNEKYEKY